jgi:hypothetical protein
MVGFFVGDLLARKYDILQQEADARSTQAAADAALAYARAGMVAPMGNAEIRQRNAQANLTNENAAQVAPLAKSRIGLEGAETRLTNTKADVLPMTAEAEAFRNKAQGGYYGSLSRASDTQTNALYGPLFGGSGGSLSAGSYSAQPGVQVGDLRDPRNLLDALIAQAERARKGNIGAATLAAKADISPNSFLEPSRKLPAQPSYGILSQPASSFTGMASAVPAITPSYQPAEIAGGLGTMRPDDADAARRAAQRRKNQAAGWAEPRGMP